MRQFSQYIGDDEHSRLQRLLTRKGEQLAHQIAADKAGAANDEAICRREFPHCFYSDLFSMTFFRWVKVCVMPCSLYHSMAALIPSSSGVLACQSKS